jgi:ubiquinone/menaquinone biosynthesis C-methylase UbiE
MMKKTILIFNILMLFALIFSYHSIIAQENIAEEWEAAYLNKRQPPEKILAAIGIKKDMVIGEIGAGRGRVTVYMAREVGPAGRVYANDIDEKSLAYLKGRAFRQGFRNIETICGQADDPRFLDNSLDMAIMVLVYHMIENPDKLLKNIISALKPGATLVIVDPKDKEIDREFGIDRSQAGNQPPTIIERIQKSAKFAGYEILRIDSFLPSDYIFILKPKSRDKKIVGAELIKAKILQSGIESGKKQFSSIKNDTLQFNFSENTFMNLAYEFYGRRTMPEAIAALNMGLSLYPKSWELYNALGEMFLVHGDKEKAKSSFEKSVEFNPENGYGQYALKNLDQIFKDMHPKNK